MKSFEYRFDIYQYICFIDLEIMHTFTRMVIKENMVRIFVFLPNCVKVFVKLCKSEIEIFCDMGFKAFAILEKIVSTLCQSCYYNTLSKLPLATLSK